MKDNEIIAREVFENVKVMGDLRPATDFPPHPHHNPKNKPFGWKRCPDYSGDPAAWTPELFDLIEEKGLRYKFLGQLVLVIGDIIGTPYPEIWAALKATPAQKASALARALARAIEEGNG